LLVPKNIHTTLFINNFHFVFVENFADTDARANVKNRIFVAMSFKRGFLEYIDNQPVNTPPEVIW